MQSDDQPDGARRPKATIEGSAREVSPPPSGAPSASAAAGGEPPPDQDRAPARASVPARAHVIAAAIAAAAAVVTVFALMAVLRFGSDTTAGAWRVLTGAEAPRLEVAALDQQTEALRARISTLERVESRLTGLGARVDAMEAAAAVAAERAGEEDAATTARIAGLETRLAAIDDATVAATGAVEDLGREIAAAAATGASAAAVATRLARETARIDALESRIGGFERNLSQAAGEAARALDAVKDRVAGAPAPDIAARLDALEAGAGRIGARIEALSMPAILATHDALVAKAAAGASFGQEAAALAAQLGDEPALRPLLDFGSRPIPTPAMLADRLDGLDAGGGDGPPAPAGEDTAPTGLVGRLLERAGNAVRIRRVSGSDNAIISRAGELLERGDITAAAATLATLPQGDARDRWLEDARARIDLDRALADLDRALDARIASAHAGGNG